MSISQAFYLWSRLFETSRGEKHDCFYTQMKNANWKYVSGKYQGWYERINIFGLDQYLIANSSYRTYDVLNDIYLI